MPNSFNLDLFDRFTMHAVDLEKFTASQRQKALRLLRNLESDLTLELAKADLPGYTITAYQQQRMQALLTQTRATIQSAYKGMRSNIESDWYKLAQLQDSFVRSSINGLAGVELASVAVSPDMLKSIVSNVVIQGAPSKDWWARQALTTQNRFADTVRQGVLAGQTNDQIAKAVRDNVTPLAAQNVDILVRTSVQTITQDARLASFAANDDVIDAIQQHSTLDGRTTEVCMAYSGAMWTNDAAHDPIDGAPPFVNDGGAPGGIPRHWGCRSYFIPVVKSWSQLTGLKTDGRPSNDPESYFRTRLLDQGLSSDEAARVIANAQASMDGQVAEAMTYDDWLRTKDEAFQKDVLGPGKWSLWQKGDITLADLVDGSGSPLTLSELTAAAADTAATAVPIVTPEILQWLAGYQATFDSVFQQFQDLVGDFGQVQGRVKSPESLAEKLVRKGYGLDRVQDGIGMRVTASNVQQVRDAFAEVQKEFKVINVENYLENPKNGYRALQMNIELPDGRYAEIQIRTARESAWAQWAHDTIYKGALAGDADAAAYGRAVSDVLWEMDNGKRFVAFPECPPVIKAARLCFDPKLANVA